MNVWASCEGVSSKDPNRVSNNTVPTAAEKAKKTWQNDSSTLEVVEVRGVCRGGEATAHMSIMPFCRHLMNMIKERNQVGHEEIIQSKSK